MVTGGVNTSEENIKSWFKAGVCGVGLGSQLINKVVLENGDFEKLKATTIDVLGIIKKTKSAQ